jgi:hypothetical protein
MRIPELFTIMPLYLCWVSKPRKQGEVGLPRSVGPGPSCRKDFHPKHDPPPSTSQLLVFLPMHGLYILQTLFCAGHILWSAGDLPIFFKMDLNIVIHMFCWTDFVFHLPYILEDTHIGKCGEDLSIIKAFCRPEISLKLKNLPPVLGNIHI